MLADDFFSILAEKLAKIETEYGKADEERKRELEHELGELRHISDVIIQMWLVFEEKMSQVAELISPHDQDLSYSPFEDGSLQAEEDNTIATLTGDSSLHFRRGQGYFDLSMYEQSLPHFSKVVEQDPDCSVARLYLALGYYLAGRSEDAHSQFNFLLHTEDHPVLRAIGHNTLGCLLAEDGRLEAALHHFSRAVDSLPAFTDALFNEGMLMVRMGNYRDAINILERLVGTDVNDWEVLLLLARAYRGLGEHQLADQMLNETIAPTRNPDALWQLAGHYEETGQYHNAAICYAGVLQTDPGKARAWHGLGWNLWLQHSTEAGLLYIKKAVSLEPRQLDYWFSYGWILQSLGFDHKADEVFSKLLREMPNHAMTLSALIVRYCGTGRLDQAEKMCLLLAESEDEKVKGLGFYHFGRIAVLKEDYAGALSFFSRSIQLTGSSMMENYLYRGICHFYTGDRQRAQEDWQRVINSNS